MSVPTLKEQHCLLGLSRDLLYYLLGWITSPSDRRILSQTNRLFNTIVNQTNTYINFLEESRLGKSQRVPRVVTDQVVSWVALRMPSLRLVHLDGCDSVTDDAIQVLVENCPQICFLDVSWCKLLSAVAISTIMCYADQLQSLRVEGLTCIGPSAFQAICLEGSCKLKALHCSMCSPGLTDECLTMLAHSRHTETLRLIDISYCFDATDAGVVELARECTRLEFLGLEQCDLVTSKSLEAIAQHMPHLWELNIKHCPQIGDVGISAITKHCPELRGLEWSDCVQVTTAGLSNIPHHLTNLQRLHLRDCEELTDTVLSAVLQQCPHLRVLKIPGAESVTGEVWARVQEWAHGEGVYLGVQTLDLSENSWVDKETLTSISECCPLLHTIQLLGCDQVDDPGVQQLIQACPGLSFLDLTGCDLVTHNAFSTSGAQDSPHVKWTGLSLAYCSPGPVGIADQLFAYIGSQLGSLTQIKLCGAKVTDAGIQILAQQCPHLVNVDLSGCMYISDQALVYLAQHCWSLQRLFVSHCVGITDDGVKALADGRCTYSLEQLEGHNLPGVTVISLEHLLCPDQKFTVLEFIAFSPLDSDAEWKTRLSMIRPFTHISFGFGTI